MRNAKLATRRSGLASLARSLDWVGLVLCGALSVSVSASVSSQLYLEIEKKRKRNRKRKRKRKEKRKEIEKKRKEKKRKKRKRKEKRKEKKEKTNQDRPFSASHWLEEINNNNQFAFGTMTTVITATTATGENHYSVQSYNRSCQTGENTYSVQSHQTGENQQTDSVDLAAAQKFDQTINNFACLQKTIRKMRPNKQVEGGFGKLPVECEARILSYTSNPDLISLSLVSKHLRDLAAAQLYRSFHIVFPDEKDSTNDTLVDSLAMGLDTFVTSDYDYSQYLKEIILETLTGGVKSQDLYSSYTYDTSCGKFMNTLLLLTLRKAKALETFKWDIRVELSREVLKELHRIEALKNFHIRMQAGTSIYVHPTNVSPNPSPYNASASDFPPTFDPFQSPFSATKSKQNGPKFRTPAVNKMSRTISGFKNLTSLSVLDMDTLDYLSEIRECIENSSTSLKSLKLSFSEELASRSRKDPVEIPQDDYDTETEDEFDQGMQIPAPASMGPFNAYNPTKAIEIEEQRKAQEAALAKIFGIEPSNSKGGAGSSSREEDEPEAAADGEKEKSPSYDLCIEIELPDLIAQSLADNISRAPDDVKREMIGLLGQISKLYTDAGKSEYNDKEASNDKEPSNENGSGAETSESSTVANPTAEGTTLEEGEAQEQSSLFDESKPATKVPKYKEIIDPDDIDIDEPYEKELLVDSGTVEGAATEPETNSETLSTKAQEHEASDVVDSTEKSFEQIAKRAKKNNKGKSKEIETPIVGPMEEMDEYILKTRGLALQHLSIYLIPLKARMLEKSIDIRELESITLLNVGPQTLFWNMVARENKVQPLKLHKIYTDNVTVPFLECVGQLANVTELFLLERYSRVKVDPAATKTTVTIYQIRKFVLQVHVQRLKVLSIHHETATNQTPCPWDLDAKTALLLCQQGKDMEELAVSFYHSILHLINQNLSMLKSLRALHAIRIHVRKGAELFWKEYYQFTMDSMAYSPDCKLEYLAQGNHVLRVLRRVKKCPLPRARKRSSVNGKHQKDLTIAYNVGNGLAGSGSGSGGGSGVSSQPQMVFAVDPATGSNIQQWKMDDEAISDWDEDEDDDESGDGYGHEFGGMGVASIGLKVVESREGFMFHNVVDVRIFEKDVIRKRL
ncbi:hypothetical protein NHQ30_008984 [Ciborinia camelliae]|nr:hypothetical protein NHQ30_008984 [Ciborinia camelliae]